MNRRFFVAATLTTTLVGLLPSLSGVSRVQAQQQIAAACVDPYTYDIVHVAAQLPGPPNGARGAIVAEIIQQMPPCPACRFGGIEVRGKDIARTIPLMTDASRVITWTLGIEPAVGASDIKGALQKALALLRRGTAGKGLDGVTRKQSILVTYNGSVFGGECRALVPAIRQATSRGVRVWVKCFGLNCSPQCRLDGTIVLTDPASMHNAVNGYVCPPPTETSTSTPTPEKTPTPTATNTPTGTPAPTETTLPGATATGSATEEPSPEPRLGWDLYVPWTVKQTNGGHREVPST